MIVLQSEPVDAPALTEQKEEVPVHIENVEFLDAGVPAPSEPTIPIEVSYGEHSDEIARMGDYLQRPVKIDQFVWNESDSFSLSPRTIYPWQLYFNNTYLKNKLSNFSRIHARLKLTIRFNASPFYYGAMRVCYDPLSSNKFAPVTTDDIVPLSQTHGIMLEPHVTSVAELELPFLWPDDWVDTATSNNFQKLGKLIYQVFVPLASANGVTGGGITVTTYAEALEVEIAGPTLTTVMQSGVISGPASRIAATARKFSNDQSIGAYARAIDVGATLVSGVAKFFGFSNPPITSDVQPMQNKVFHAFANVETSVPLDKLAIDPKNEVTIDTRVAGGSGKDELIIQDLVTKPSVVQVVNWTTAGVAGDVLAYGSVTPCILQQANGTQQIYQYRTPSAFVAAMFRYWRGGMRYTFRVIRSKYHRGRLLVTWEPNGNPSLASETALFSKIFDLTSEEQEFTFDIPYKAISPWLRTVENAGVDTSLISYSQASTNGSFVIGILNPLTAPVADSTVGIIISAEALPDMEFAAPKALPQLVTTATVQSGTVDGSAISYSDHIPDITVGERVASLRPLLHRASLACTQYLGLSVPASQTLTPGMYHGTNFYNRFPPVGGYSTALAFNAALSALDGTTKKSFNYAHHHPINWVLAAFAGFRGSFVVHANVHQGGTTCGMDGMSLTRTDHGWGPANSANNTVNNACYIKLSTDDGAARIGYDVMQTPGGQVGTVNGALNVPNGAGGMTVTNGHTQMAVSAVLPQYSSNRLNPAWFTQRDTDLVGVLNPSDGIRLDGDFCIDGTLTSTKAWPRVDMYWAAGVDFTTVFFTGVPRMYKYSSLPVPIVTNF